MRCRAFFLSKLDLALLIRAVARLHPSRPRFAITCLCPHITVQHLAMPLPDNSSHRPHNALPCCTQPLPSLLGTKRIIALPSLHYSLLCLCLSVHSFAVAVPCLSSPCRHSAMLCRCGALPNITNLCPHEAFTSVISVKQRPLPDDLH